MRAQLTASAETRLTINSCRSASSTLWLDIVNFALMFEMASVKIPLVSGITPCAK